MQKSDTNSPSSVYLRCLLVALLDVLLSTPASSSSLAASVSDRIRAGINLT